MDTLQIVIGLELGELSLEVTPVPKQHMVEKLSPRGAHEPLNKGMGNRIVWHRLDLIDLQNPKVGFPAMEIEQGIVIGTDVSGCALTTSGVIEQSAECGPIDTAALDSESDDAAGKLIHDHKHPADL